MNHQDVSANQVETEIVEDLELTDKQAEETKAGDNERCEPYLELKLDHLPVNNYSK